MSKTALVLPGGGALCAYQVGALKAIAEILPDRKNPFPIIAGTSAGAVAAALLASNAEHWRIATRNLEDVWSHFHLQQVIKVDRWSMAVAGLRWLLSLLSAGRIRPPNSLFDNQPLRELLDHHIDPARIQHAIRADALTAIAISATAYSSGTSVTFFDGQPELDGWARIDHCGRRVSLTTEHVMASLAIPAFFPAISLHGHFFGDGAMRMRAPLSPAIKLGADRLLIIGVRQKRTTGAADNTLPETMPTPAGILGFMLDTLFSNEVFRDLELLEQLNVLARERNLATPRQIAALRLAPSVDLPTLAAQHVGLLPGSVRALLGVLGGRRERRGLLASYLLFESDFTRLLIELGYRDTLTREQEVRDFLQPELTGLRDGRHP